MNISIAIEKFDPRVGGAERYCWDLAQFLAQRGHEVSVICMQATGLPHPGVRIIKVPVLRFPQFLRHTSFAMLHFLKARKMQGFIHFCVGNTFYMNVYQPHGGVHRAWFFKETARHEQPARSLIRLLMRLSLKDMVQRAMEWCTFRVARPQVIAISEMVAKDIRDFYHYPQDKIHLIPNGVDIDKFRPEHGVHREAIRQRYGIGKDDFVFLFVAQNPRLKGFDVLINACLELAPLPFKVLVIGHTDAWMKNMAKPLGDRVIFGGRADDLQKVYPACDCLVHPTHYDACSLVVLESLSSCVPVITTGANGASMYINESNGLVIDPGDAAALSGAMKDMMTNSHGSVIPGRSFLKDYHAVFSDVEEVLKKS